MFFCRYIYCIAFVLICSYCFAQPDIDTIKNRLTKYYVQDGVSDSLVKQLIDSFNEDPLNPDVMIKELYERIDDNQIKHLILTQQKNGSWNDIEYNDNSLSNWAPAKHANNIILLAKGFCFRNSTYYQNQLILDAVHKALKYWFEGNFVCANWWYNQIGVPRILGGAFLLLEPYLTKDELTKAITYMSNAKISMTGQNKIWLAGNVLVNAILRNDTIQFSEAANSIKSEISISNGEGIKSDYSFHQHGAQQQFGNYGLAYINSMTYWAKIFAGTKYAFANDQINVLRSYMLNGMAWIVWKGYMDVSSCGRQLFKNSLRGKSLSFGKSIVNMMQVDPFYKTSYENTYKTDILNSQQLNIKKGFKYFWCSDMAVFRNAKWAATLKMSSSRVIGSEVVNYENINGKLLGDGALYIYQTGKEYNNIFPVWDWSKIPGVTAYESTVTQTNKGWMNYQNKSSFVGGVSDSINGIAVFKHEKDSVHARKSYFFIDNKIVCMGSGINGDDFNFPVTTTINQCIANGAVWFNSNRNWHQLNEAVVAKDIQRVYHDNIVYTFLEKANVFLSCKLQKGSWRQVANMYDTAVEEKKVFKLFIRHPIMQKNNHYAYMIEPSSKLNRFGKNEINDIRILCHNEKVHALALNKNKEYFISFFDPSSIRLSNRQYLKVSEPCILMLEEKPDKKYVLSLAEPTQQIHSLVIELSGRFYCSEAMSEQQGDVTVLKVDLKENYGKTLQLHLSVLE